MVYTVKLAELEQMMLVHTLATPPTLPSPPSVLTGAREPTLSFPTRLWTRINMGLLSRNTDSRTPRGVLPLVVLPIEGEGPPFWPPTSWSGMTLPPLQISLRPCRTLLVCDIIDIGTLVTWVMRTLNERLALFSLSPCRKMTRPFTLPMSMRKPPMCGYTRLTLPSLRQRAVKSAPVRVDGRPRRHLITVYVTETLLQASALWLTLLSRMTSWLETPPRTSVDLSTLITKADLFRETPLEVLMWAKTPLMMLTRVDPVGMNDFTRVTRTTSVARCSRVDPFDTPGFATTTTRRLPLLSTMLPGIHLLFMGSRALTIGRCFR